ncbi:lytic murein transglycosylase [Stakelama saccharophila]|uniref:Lytic murein transglycosylase n=1 Tax=Stakelama saccharophila TaxID=3075605 RepID=A0ABZ0B692_9SPHN|nr:lytic murein transglycosylase [Stakelama sp. W311]WNO52525.1 lytic murein transglycosylase [Stakelama sp. W311]
MSSPRFKSRLALYLSVAGLLTASATSACAQTESGFQGYLKTLQARAAREGVSNATIDAVFPTLTLNERVIELDRDQPGGNPNAPIPDYAPYYARHVDAARIRLGRAAYLRNRDQLRSIEQETGVPESIMVSIWGNETAYGAVTGGFDLPRALATLAYEGRRRELFSEEFIAALKIMDRGIPRDTLQGSWAGATGGPQFLPSVYLRLARDGDGDGKADIWNSDADTLASIANYFVNAGWRPGEPWGIPVRVPTNYNRSAMVNRTFSPRCPRVHERYSQWRTMKEWRAMGFVAERGTWPDDDIQATLLEPDGPGKTAYLLTGNYRVILDYNCSNFYALTVGLLADEIEQ